MTSSYTGEDVLLSTPVVDPDTGQPVDSSDITSAQVLVYDTTGTLVVTGVLGQDPTVLDWRYLWSTIGLDPGRYNAKFVIDGLGSTTVEWLPVDLLPSPLDATSPAQTGGQTCTPWAAPDDVPAGNEDVPDELLLIGLQVSSDVLYQLTGRRWAGVCTDLVRPTACGCVSRAGWWLPPGVHAPSVPMGGVDRLGALCGCGCSGVSEVKLPGYPVRTITEVVIDGQVVAPDQYRVDQRRKLVCQATTGRSAWPCCQRLDLPAGEPGTWSVEYEFGQAPPIGGVTSAASLGLQLALAIAPPAFAGRCRLPKRVTSITRQGVTVAILDPLSLFKDGLTGLPEVDLWVASVLAGDGRRRATAWVPGRHQASRRTTT